MFAPQPSRKRSFEPDSQSYETNEPSEKKARPTTCDSSDGWLNDSVIGTPTRKSSAFQQAKYDSDSQSSMVSEPGSPQSLSAADSDMDMDVAADSDERESSRPIIPVSSPAWRHRGQQRVATPFQLRRPGVRPVHVRTGAQTHIRARHPQEAGVPDRLEVPSPIDEDEVPTPPSAAEAAGSQLSMLSVDDVNMDDDSASTVPTISVDPSHGLPFNEDAILESDSESTMDSRAPETVIVRKQRQRSGALSSPRGTPGPDTGIMRRGLSMGFRADCEKCRLRVPGHMNHFLE